MYVNDLDNPTEVVGYRNGQDWFDENGEAINDFKTLAQASTTGQITPYLVNQKIVFLSLKISSLKLIFLQDFFSFLFLMRAILAHTMSRKDFNSNRLNPTVAANT